MLFTVSFTSPLKRSISELQSSGQVMSRNNSFYIDSFGNNDQQRYPENFTLSSPGFNMIGGDALSVLLEQKLQELSCKVESSQCNPTSEETSAAASYSSGLQDMASGVASTASRGKKFELSLRRDEFDSINHYGCLLSVDVNQQWKLKIKWDYSLHMKALPAYNVSELFDSASSAASTGEVSGKNMTRILGSHYLNQTNNWELEYVRYILSNVDLEMEDFCLLGDAQTVITPSLFIIGGSRRVSEAPAKIVFDCVNESLQFRLRAIFCRRATKHGDKWQHCLRGMEWVS
ncbi:hypothetical protein GBA52_018255 [Prunus armeniaca]|nr:hypothetical protein GBA52_018255 [Prunus armeniaca]